MHELSQTVMFPVRILSIALLQKLRSEFLASVRFPKDKSLFLSFFQSRVVMCDDHDSLYRDECLQGPIALLHLDTIGTELVRVGCSQQRDMMALCRKHFDYIQINFTSCHPTSWI